MSNLTVAQLKAIPTLDGFSLWSKILLSSDIKEEEVTDDTIIEFNFRKLQDSKIVFSTKLNYKLKGVEIYYV